MIKTIDLGGCMRAVISTRATGKVRIAIEHEFHDQCRVDVDHVAAWQIAEAIRACAVTGARTQRDAGEGPQCAAPQRQAGFINWPWAVILGTGMGLVALVIEGCTHFVRVA